LTSVFDAKKQDARRMAGVLEARQGGGCRLSTIRMTDGDTIDVGAADADIVEFAVGEIAQFLKVLTEAPPLAEETYDVRQQHGRGPLVTEDALYCSAM
jgi:hypothetical protein